MMQNQLLLVVFTVLFPRYFCMSSAKLLIVSATEPLLDIGGLQHEQVNILRSEEKR